VARLAKGIALSQRKYTLDLLSDVEIIKIEHVSSGQQIADCLTKGLGTAECNLACDKMGMIDIYHPS
jgi:hypothetical protein